jgi:hypothetical protein
LGKAILNGRCHKRFSATCYFRPPIIERVDNVTSLGGGDDRCLASQAQVKTQHSGTEEIFRTIEPTFAFGVIFTVAILNPRFP